MTGRAFSKLFGARDGAAALEFALLAIPFLMISLGAIEFGRLVWTRDAVQGAAAQGARCMGVLATSCASAGVYSQASSIAYIQGVAKGWGITLTPAQMTLSASASSGACAGLSEVSITYVFQTLVPGLLAVLSAGTTLTGHACFPNQS